MKERLFALVMLLCLPPLAFGLVLFVSSVPSPILWVIGPLLSWLIVLGHFGHAVSLVTWPVAVVLLGFGWKTFSARERIYASATLAVAAVPIWIIVEVGW